MAGRMPTDHLDLQDCSTTSSSDTEMEPTNTEGAAASGMAAEAAPKTLPEDTVHSAIDRLLERNRRWVPFNVEFLLINVNV